MIAVDDSFLIPQFWQQHMNNLSLSSLGRTVATSYLPAGQPAFANLWQAQPKGTRLTEIYRSSWKFLLANNVSVFSFANL